MFKQLRKIAKSTISVLLIFSLLLTLTPIANASNLVIDDETLVSWDSYVQDYAGEIAATQADLPSEPQTVDMTQTDAIMPVSEQPALRASGIQSTSADTKRYSVLVLDTSGSMRGTPLTRTKQAAVKFCEQVLAAEGDNYVAVVSFNTSATTVCNFSNDLNALTNSINALYYTGSTSQHAGLVLADSLLDNVSASGAIKNIVLMSDGLPETGAYSFNGPYTSSDYAYGYHYANAAYEKANELKTRYSIYSLGFFHSLSGSYLSFGRRFMEDLQNAGYYEVINPDDLDFEFGKIADDILKKSGTFMFRGQIIESHDSESIYFYDDRYFLQDAKYYNPQLATMSLCFELSSWPSYDTGDWPDRTKNARELLTGEVLTGKGRYSPGTGGLGFKEFAQNEVWLAPPTRDSIGVVAANKTITDGDKKYTLIALAVRGGGYYSEWAGNFEVGKSGSHAGFTKAKEEVLRFLEEYISKHSITEEIKLWVVGYSRAGAVANMVGGALDDGYSLPNVTLEHKDLFVYTFEAPQGALEATVVGPGHGDYSNIHNIINLNDPVPLVAPYPWGFVRYSKDKDEIRLPNAELSSNFFSKRLAMLKEFYKFEGAIELGYKIEEYSTKDVLKIDRSKILPFGDPFWWWEESKVSQRRVLDNAVDFLAIDVLKSRAYYANFMEKGVSEIIGLLSKDDSGIMYKLITELAKRLDKDRFVEIIKPLFSINPYYSLDERTSDVKKNVRQFVSEVKATLNITVSLIALLDILDNLVDQFVIDILNNNTDTINLIIKLVDLANVGSLKQAHYPEICLAWLMSRDLNYNRSAIAETVPGAYRIIRINCPVDVNVYDSNNTIVASIDNDVPQDVGSTIICYINDNDEKIIYLPADEDYQINIQATEDGEMTYSASEYNLTKNGISRLINYYNVPLTTGATFTGVVDSFSTAEIENGTPDGSAVEYKLLDSSSAEIPGWEEISGADVTNNYFKVFVAPNNDSGYVDGSGTFIKGSFAKVEAMPLSGSSFLGWYIDDELVSEDATYRFAVKENVNLIAKFVPVEKHALKLNAKSGGKITSVEGFYTVGTEIAVVAEANDGYVFKNWTSSEGGTFAEANSVTTTFIMPGNDVTVTAHFELVSPSSSLVGRWSFDEGCGTAAADTSGNNLNGVVSGATWVDGKVGKALKFDGVNDYVEIPYDPILNPTKAITIEAWINPCSTAVDQRILSKSPYPNNDYSMIRASNNRVLVSVKMGGTVQSAYSPANSVPVGTWTHVVGTYDGQRMRLYINGTQVNSFAVCGEINAHETPLMIGKNATSAYFKGMVDEICIYDKALTADEILSHYQAAMPTAVTAIEAETTDDGKKVVVAFDKEMADLPAAPAGFCLAVDGVENPIQSVGLNASKDLVELTLANTIYTDSTNIKLSYTAGTIKAEDGGVLASFSDMQVTNKSTVDKVISSLVGRWSFDEGCGTAAADTSGNNLNGVINGATWVDGKVGKALKFDGVNDYAEIPYNPILNPTKAITIEAWINPCSTAADQRILSKSPYPNNDYSMIRASNNRVLVSMKINGTVQSAYSPANAVPVGSWTHVVGTYDGQRMRLYINGTQVNSFAVCGEINAHETPLMIGKNATSTYFKGMVDEVCIYDKALTANEILSHYQAAQDTTE